MKRKMLAWLLLMFMLVSQLPAYSWELDQDNPNIEKIYDDNVKMIGFKFAESYQSSKGYNYGDETFYKHSIDGLIFYINTPPGRDVIVFSDAIKNLYENKNASTAWRKGTTKNLIYEPTGGRFSDGEYRYLGYTEHGEPLTNPNFPRDVDNRPLLHQTFDWWAFNDANPTDGYYKPSAYIKTNSNMELEKAKRTFEIWFEKTQRGQMFFEEAQKYVPAGSEWEYWNERLMILGDIDKGGVVIKGYHRYYNSGAPTNFYATYPVPSDRNLAIVNLYITDEADRNIASFTRWGGSSNVPVLKDSSDLDPENHKPNFDDLVLERNHDYTVHVWVRNFSIEDGIPTIYPGMYIDTMNKDGYINNLETKVPNDGLRSYDMPDTIVSGEFAKFSFPLRFDESSQGSDFIEAIIPEAYYPQDNTNFIDDHARIDFRVGNTDDLGLQSIILNNGSSDVSYPTPHIAHVLKIGVGHILGNSTIGTDAGLNPKATVDVEVFDKNNNLLKSETVQSHELLAPGESLEVQMGNVSTAGSYIKVCATINPVHAEKGFNSRVGNDKLCRIFSEFKNYSVSNVRVSPHKINMASTEYSQTLPVTFNFAITHTGISPYGRTPTVVIRENGVEIFRKAYDLPEGTYKNVTETIGNRTFTRGSGPTFYEIEINPDRNPRELKVDGTDPYVDNQSGTSVTMDYYNCTLCSIDNTRNEWTETFTFKETEYELVDNGWYEGGMVDKGWYEDRTVNVWGEDPDNPGSWIIIGTRIEEVWRENLVWDPEYRWVNNWEHESVITTWNEDRTFYEEYKIKKVSFASKWSRDTGAGIIDVTSLPNDPVEGMPIVKVKAGNAFEVIVEVGYKTDRAERQPLPPPVPTGGSKPSDNSSEVSPSAPTPIMSPNAHSIRQEFPIMSNHPTVVDVIKSEGSWYDHVKTYSLEPKDILGIGLGAERKIYTPVKAKPGLYRWTIDTTPFLGYSGVSMCEDFSFIIEILPNDDMKTHIIQ